MPAPSWPRIRGVSAGYPDEHSGAPDARRQKRGLHRLGSSRRLDRVVDAAARDLADGLRRLLGAPGPADGVGGAERKRRVELVAGDVDRDDRRGADRDGGEDGTHAHAAAAQHGDPFARPYSRGTPDRARAGGDGAAHQGSDVERVVVGDRHAAAGGHHGPLGEGGQKAVVVDGLVVARQPRRPVQEPARGHRRPGRGAEVWQLAQTLLAASAGRDPRQHHALPRRERHPGPDGLDDARPLMTQHRGADRRGRPVPSIAFRSEWQTRLRAGAPAPRRDREGRARAR